MAYDGCLPGNDARVEFPARAWRLTVADGAWDGRLRGWAVLCDVRRWDIALVSLKASLLGLAVKNCPRKLSRVA